MTLLKSISNSLCYINFTTRIHRSQIYFQKFITTSHQMTNTISPDKVLSKENRENCLKQLNSIKEIKFFATKNLKKAAVLIPLINVDNKLAFLYTERSLHLKVNGGEIAFPGGMQEESDGSFKDGCIGGFRTLEKTALREAYEEIGLPPDKVDIWGKGPEIHRVDLKVTPFLGYVGQLKFQKLKLNINEVVSIFPVTLENLSSSKNFRITRFRASKTSVFVTPVYLGGEKRIWGLTAYITHIMLSSLIPDIYDKNIAFLPVIQNAVHYGRRSSHHQETKN